MSNLLECTRCQHELRTVEPNATWLRYFVCDECWLAYHLHRDWNKRHTNYTLFLMPGRKPRTPVNEIERLVASTSPMAWQASVMIAKGVKP